MKKGLFAALFAALLLVTLLVPGVSAAAGKVSLSASGAPQAGKTVTLTVKLSDATNVSGIAVTPTFDKGQFTLTDGKWVAEGGLISDFSVENGDGVIAFAAPTKVSGQILTFTLKVNAKTAAGKYTVGCSVVVSDDSGNHTLTAQTSVTVSCTHSFTAQNTAAKYQKSAASCTSGAVYYYSCAHCGEKGDKTFVSGEKTAHTFDRKKETAAFVHTKGSCTERGVYYYSCVCGEKGTETFVGAAPAHKVDEGWKTDEASHWHLCTACGEVSDKAAHTPSAPATETTPETCTVCGYVLAPALGHEHDFTAKPHQDEAHHWGECACGEVSDKAAHNWGDGKIFAADNEKLTLFTCPDCGAEKYEKAALGDDTPNNTPDAPADNDADTATESGSFGGGLAVGGIVGLLIGAAVMLVVKKKK